MTRTPIIRTARGTFELRGRQPLIRTASGSVQLRPREHCTFTTQL